MLVKSYSDAITCNHNSKPSKVEHIKLMEPKRIGVGSKIHFINNYRYRNVVASRSVPILFIVTCFLVNTLCDEVGSANADPIKADNNNKVDKEEAIRHSKLAASSAAETTSQTKLDPLSVLREIYLDHDSKIITLLSPSNVDSVQKFHPNGRYGRRSVNSLYGEPSAAHTELGKLRFNPTNTMTIGDETSSGSIQSLLTSGFGGQNQNSKFNPHNRALFQPTPSTGPMMDELTDSGMSNYEFEMNKLLKCNYTGLANLYWCNTGT